MTQTYFFLILSVIFRDKYKAVEEETAEGAQKAKQQIESLKKKVQDAELLQKASRFFIAFIMHLPTRATALTNIKFSILFNFTLCYVSIQFTIQSRAIFLNLITLARKFRLLT